jgi:Cu2+-exporting ATPase
MFIQLGILAASYLGVRLLEHHREKKRCLATLSGRRREIQESPEQGSIIDRPEKEYTHYFRWSLAALAVALTAPLGPVFYAVGLGMIVYSSIPILRTGERQLIEKRTIGHDALFSLFILMSFATHAELYAALGIFLYHAGSKVLAMNHALTEPIVSDVFGKQSQKVWVLKEAAEIEMSLADVSVGDVVVLRAGETVPIDGVIVDGIAMVDQHVLTGESRTVEKTAGDQVFSSTLVVNGQITVRVEKAGHETAIYKIGEVLNATSNYATSVQLKGEQWANRIALPVIGLTVASIPILGLTGATTVISTSFGNRLRVLTPIGTLNYLHAAYSMGIVIKDGRAIEETNQIDTVLFDKTGTLTKDHPEVGTILSYSDDLDAKDILAYAATAERKLTHPLAEAIVKKADESELELPSVDDSEYKVGYGVTVNIRNRRIHVGSARFMEMESIDVPEMIGERIEQSCNEGFSLVLVAMDSKIVGTIAVESALRPEVRSVLEGLRKRGITHISIVSGDHRYPTEKLAESLGMDSCFYEVLPEQKADVVRKLQDQGKRVCFVGDGINDAIAMKAANVSVSLAGATSVATDTAQAILMSGNLSHLNDLFDVSRRLNNNLLRTFAIMVVPAFISMGGALFLGMRLAGSFVIMYSAFAIGLGNAMLPALTSKFWKDSETAKEVKSPH